MRTHILLAFVALILSSCASRRDVAINGQEADSHARKVATWGQENSFH